MRRLSLSSLGRVRVCPGSAVLPQIQSHSLPAAIGNAGHDWIDSAVRSWTSVRGRANLVDIADRWELWGESRETFFRYVRGLGNEPPVPEGTITEQPLALLEDGSVVPVRGGRGEYEAPEGTIIAGTLDAMWPERDGVPSWFLYPDGGAPRVDPADVLVISDWKTGGAESTPPPRFNWQLKGQALLASRWTGARRVLPMLGLIDGGPVRWETEQDRHGFAVVLDEVELASIEREIRRIVAVVDAQDPDAPKVVTGAHCSFCPARAACPAHVAAPRAMIAAVPDPKAMGPLSREEAHQLLPIVLSVGPARESALVALKEHVRLHGPIALPDGRLWGLGEAKRVEFNTAGAFDALVDALIPLVGEDEALRQAQDAFRTTRDAVYEAVSRTVDEVNAERKQRGEKRVTKKSIVDPMFETMKKSGAMTYRTIEEFEARWPVE